jgi:hypothetical protein
MTHILDPVIAGTGTIIAASSMYLLAVTPEQVAGWEKVGVIGILVAGIVVVSVLYAKERKRADDEIREMAIFKNDNNKGLAEIKSAIEAQTRIVQEQQKIWNDLIMPVVKDALAKK